MLTERWYQLKRHDGQVAYAASAKRFDVCHAGRRGGKTEIAKRKFVRRACSFCAFPDGLFYATAPVQHQAEHIYWADLKALTPPNLVRKISESDKMILLKTGTTIGVAGLDKPERIEGRPVDGVLLDEYADMKADVWQAHVRPALSTLGRPGWAMFIGVPEGRNHFFQLMQRALENPAEWGVFHWPSSDILDAAEIESARRELDQLTFDQEYGGLFVAMEGRAYYAFVAPPPGQTTSPHVVDWLEYDPDLPLIINFDFNVAPGVALICQEQVYKGKRRDVAETFTACLSEIYIERNSNTARVCAKVAQEWGSHEGFVRCYGDASGGAQKSSAVAGSDWDLIRQSLAPVFGERLGIYVPKANPPERVRVNAVNSRLLSASGKIKLLVQGGRDGCPKLIKDFEGVPLKDDGSGAIDKKKDPALTHISDALGYYVAKAHPVRGGEAWSQEGLNL